MSAAYVIVVSLLSAFCALGVVACEEVCRDAPNVAVHAGCAR
jgi:hypothetical protein